MPLRNFPRDVSLKIGTPRTMVSCIRLCIHKLGYIPGAEPQSPVSGVKSLLRRARTLRSLYLPSAISDRGATMFLSGITKFNTAPCRDRNFSAKTLFDIHYFFSLHQSRPRYYFQIPDTNPFPIETYVLKYTRRRKKILTLLLQGSRFCSIRPADHVGTDYAVGRTNG